MREGKWETSYVTWYCCMGITGMGIHLFTLTLLLQTTDYYVMLYYTPGLYDALVVVVGLRFTNRSK